MSFEIAHIQKGYHSPRATHAHSNTHRRTRQRSPLSLYIITLSRSNSLLTLRPPLTSGASFRILSLAADCCRRVSSFFLFFSLSRNSNVCHDAYKRIFFAAFHSPRLAPPPTVAQLGLGGCSSARTAGGGRSEGERAERRGHEDALPELRPTDRQHPAGAELFVDRHTRPHRRAISF